MCHDMLCQQITDMYVCQCLFDEVVKIRFSPQARCHDEIVRSIMLVADQKTTASKWDKKRTPWWISSQSSKSNFFTDKWNWLFKGGSKRKKQCH